MMMRFKGKNKENRENNNKITPEDVTEVCQYYAFFYLCVATSRF